MIYLYSNLKSVKDVVIINKISVYLDFHKPLRHTYFHSSFTSVTFKSTTTRTTTTTTHHHHPPPPPPPTTTTTTTTTTTQAPLAYGWRLFGNKTHNTQHTTHTQHTTNTIISLTIGLANQHFIGSNLGTNRFYSEYTLIRFISQKPRAVNKT